MARACSLVLALLAMLLTLSGADAGSVSGCREVCGDPGVEGVGVQVRLPTHAAPTACAYALRVALPPGVQQRQHWRSLKRERGKAEAEEQVCTLLQHKS